MSCQVLDRSSLALSALADIPLLYVYEFKSRATADGKDSTVGWTDKGLVSALTPSHAVVVQSPRRTQQAC